MDSEKKIAVLIDADNVSNKYIKPILDELSKYGTPTYKRIYGDWTRPEMTAWKGVLLTNSITPVQQYSYTSGKNATDSALIIDAMDILYTGHVDSFCIVSSDSDFTKLAARLREAGTHVIGMGEKKTPQPFISACEVFKYLEVLVSNRGLVADEEGAAGRGGGTAAVNETAAKYNVTRAAILQVIQKIVEDTSEEDGWTLLAMVGSVLNKQQPDFDARNYGYSKLTQFIKSLDCFEIEQRPIQNSGGKQTYVRLKAGEKVDKGEKPAPRKKPRVGGGPKAAPKQEA